MPVLSLKTRLIAAGAVFMMLIGLPLIAILWMTSVPGRSHEGALPRLAAAQEEIGRTLERHVVAIASTPHNVSHPEELERAARYIESTLRAAGYDPQAQPFRAGDTIVRNIEAVIEPADASAPTLVVGAHYDSFLDAPGADDNGSGTAAVLELARMLADLRHKSPLRIRLVLFVNEEPPFFMTELMGSRVYADRLQRTGERIFGMFSLETLGYYSDAPNSQRYPPPLNALYPSTGNFLAFVGLTPSRDFVRRSVATFRAVAAFPSEGGTAPAFVQGIDWSDHWAFQRLGVNALMITDTAPFRYPHYHSVQDTPDKLDYDKLARVTTGLEKVIRSWAQGTRMM